MWTHTDFVVGTDDFEQISVHAKMESNYYWLYHNERRRKIRYFILDDRPKVHYVCAVTLIKKDGDKKFTPRLHFTVRNKKGNTIATKEVAATPENITIKGSVSFTECHLNFWKLMSYLKNMAELDVPDESFSLHKKSQEEITDAFSKLDPTLAKDIVKRLAEGITFTAEDLNQMLRRKEQLAEFEGDLIWYGSAEEHWQEFFHNNKWIFGYGLNYVILDVNGHAYVGGKDVEGHGGQNPDFLGITQGNVKFSVIVEIKTPNTDLLRGDQEIRSGAWSLSKELTDAVAQLQANTDEWNVGGSRTRQNQAKLKDVQTITPKGILVIGSLQQIQDTQSKIFTFERFRRSLSNIEIITFDELLERARYIVEQQPTL
jgi:hypothetical protein